MHLHARDLFCEFLDPESGEPVGPGGTGELVATQLGPRALPLVRYAPGDVFRLLDGACPCGDPSLRVVFVGQKWRHPQGEGGPHPPAQVHKALSEMPEARRFQIVVDHPEGQRYERAVLRVGLASEPADRAAFAARVAERVKATVLISMDVELVPEAQVPEGAAGPRFAEAMVDLRKKG